MKRIVLASLVALCLLSVVSAYAQDVKIGYVDMRRVMIESKSGSKVRAEIEKTIKERRESLARDEQQLKNLQQAFEKDKLLLSESQRATKQNEFEEKVKAFQKARADAQREIEQKERDFTSKALPKVREIIRVIAKEQKLSLVFEKNEAPVLYAADGPDLTEKVIQRFDAGGSGAGP
jgi:outer membrane protein